MARKRIDNIAKYRQQPRGPPPKRRTDFSIFVCTSSSISSPDAQDGLSSVATTRINKVEDIGKGPTGCTFVPCNNQRCTRTELSDGHLTENDRVDPNEQADSLIDRDRMMRTQEDDVPCTSDPHVTRSSDACMTACLDEKDNRLSDGFQDSSKQVSNEGGTSSSTQLFNSPNKMNFSNQQQQSSGGLTLSNSTELEDESSDRGRGKRKRKPKIHFGEEPDLPLRSVKKVRRFRIMRYLGLMAPLGSPF